MPRPIILGVVGDSAAGKTTITRGLVRILGDEKVTHVCTDDYHRYDRKQRAELDITPLDPECNYVDIMGAAPAAPPPRRADPQARVQPRRRYLRPARLRRAPRLHRYRGPARLPHARHARLLRRARLPRPSRGAASQVEGLARHLASRLHHRQGALRARPARARLGGLHPAPGEGRGHRDRVHACRSERRLGDARRRAGATAGSPPPRPVPVRGQRRAGHTGG